MKPSDLLIYLIPIVVIGVIMAYQLRRKRAPARNLFKDGTPVKLPKRIDMEYQISRDEFIEANSKVSGKMFLSRRVKIFAGVIIFFVLINLITTPFFVSDYHFDYTGVIVPVAMFALVLVFSGLTIKKSAGRIYDSTEFIKQKVKYVFDADSYELISPVTTSKAGWEAVQGYLDTEKHLLVFTGTTQALFLNKQAFAPGDLDTLKAFLVANFEEKKRLY